MFQSESSRIAILMCTCESYTEVARSTCDLIDIFWQEHPEVFILGGKKFNDRYRIPFSCDEKDWIGMTSEAVSWLEKQGYGYCYLILDDHPPIGKCNADFLNYVLPELSQKCRATHVALAGWDQFQPKDGTIVSVGSHRMMKNNESYKWKFDLHPGFWNLSDLGKILKQVMNASPRVFSAREFEGISGSGDLHLPAHFLSATYKIEGDCNVIGQNWFQHWLKRRTILYTLHALRLLARLGGQTLLSRIDDKTEVYTQYINGPYPIYWSGVIKKGSLNTNFLKFVEITKDNILLNWLKTFNWPPID